jgi:hypothetical protein
MTVEEIVEEFVSKVTALIEAQTRETVLEALGEPPPKKANGNGNGKPKTTSPAQSEARKLQGQFMGNMRNLSKADVEKVKALRAKDGVKAAIKLAVALKAKNAA